MQLKGGGVLGGGFASAVLPPPAGALSPVWVCVSGENEQAGDQTKANYPAGSGVVGASLASGTEGLSALECDVEVLLLGLQHLALRCIYSALVTTMQEMAASTQRAQGCIGRLDSQGVVVDIVLEALKQYAGLLCS
jgi:hypothetical protein